MSHATAKSHNNRRRNKRSNKRGNKRGNLFSSWSEYDVQPYQEVPITFDVPNTFDEVKLAPVKVEPVKVPAPIEPAPVAPAQVSQVSPLPFATPAPASAPNKRDLHHLDQGLQEVISILDSCVLRNMIANAHHTPMQQRAPITKVHRLKDSQIEILSKFPLNETLSRIGELREVLAGLTDH